MLSVNHVECSFDWDILISVETNAYWCMNIDVFFSWWVDCINAIYNVSAICMSIRELGLSQYHNRWSIVRWSKYDNHKSVREIYKQLFRRNSS